MKKLSGGSELSCGHTQQLSERRLAIANAGQEQHSIYCMDCEDWSRVVPVIVTSQEED